MIDPVIFTINLGKFQFSLHWYGVLVMISVLVGEWIAERLIRRRGENPEHLWEGLIWAIPAGVVGARLWYVINDILGGGTWYASNPVRILQIWEGGLHFYGAVLAGGLAFYLYARRNKVDMRLILDVVGPSLLIGQGIARFGNYINQELYGPPTDLPWGIRIPAQQRMPPWHDLVAFPEETTRFHPTFAYEMLWNFLSAGLLLWLSRRFEKKVKPGSVFAGWLVLAGIGRVWIEAFRPDQPRLPGTDLSYSRIVAGVMALVGVVILLVKYEVIRVPFLSPGPATYAISPAALPSAAAESGGDEPEQVSSTDEPEADGAGEPMTGGDEEPAAGDDEGTEEDVDDGGTEGE
jgi:phosphatidylglycerol:prolipoprotein diacylglycerol transferase